MTIGNNIKRVRTHKNITQGELANMIGVSSAAISQFEKSDNLRMETIKKIAKALEVEVNELIPVTIATPGNLRTARKPEFITDAEALVCTNKLLDYAECDISLSVDEIKRIMTITKELHKALIKDIRDNSGYLIIK